MKHLLTWGAFCLLSLSLLAVPNTDGHTSNEVAQEIADIRMRLGAAERTGHKDLQLHELRQLRDLQVRHGSTDSVLISSMRVVELSGLSTDRYAMAHDWQVLSTVSLRAGDLPRAIEACKRQLLVLRSLNDKRAESDAQMTLLDLLMEARLYDEFRHQSELVLQASTQSGDELGQARVLYRQGEVFILQGRAPDALSLLHASLRKEAHITDPAETGRIWFLLARTYAAIAQWDVAFSAYQKGLELAPDAPRSSPALYGLLGKIHEQLGHLSEALLYERLQNQAKDSLISSVMADRAIRLQSLRGVGAQGDELSQQQEIREASAVKLGALRTRLRWAVIAAIALAVGFTLSLLHRAVAQGAKKVPVPVDLGSRSGPGGTSVDGVGHPRSTNPPQAAGGPSPRSCNIHLVELLVGTLYGQSNDIDRHLVLAEVQARVSVMRQIQEALRRSALVGSINLRAHFTDIANALVHERGQVGTFDLKLDLGGIGDVYQDDLIPLSLLVSELIRGSLDAAAQGISVGTVELSLRQLAPDMMELLYSDHGASNRAHAVNNGSISGSLVRTWATALDGSLRLLKGETTTLQFTFRTTPTALRRAS